MCHSPGNICLNTCIRDMILFHLNTRTSLNGWFTHRIFQEFCTLSKSFASHLLNHLMNTTLSLLEISMSNL